MAGYSNRPLRDKLGIKPETRILIRNPPPDYFELLAPLPEKLNIARQLRGQFDFIQAFYSRLQDLATEFPRLKRCLATDGMLWISWPKKSSGITADITEDRIREIGLDCGLVDVKVCAVDPTWSGLKFMYRKTDR